MRTSVLYLVVSAALMLASTVVKARPQQFSRPGGNNGWNQGGNGGWNQGGNPGWNQGGNNGGNNNNNIPMTSSTSSTTPRPGTTVATTASPAFLACMQRCGTTMEYNPVCGSDSINYHNEGRLRCAAMCGKNVATVRMGTCSPL